MPHPTRSIILAALTAGASLALISSNALPEPASPSSGGVEVVAQLYRDFAWEVVVDEPIWHGHSLAELPRKALARYFDDSLVKLFLNDRACEEKGQGICRLDFDVIWDSQDPAGANAVNVTATKDSNVVAVAFRRGSNGETTKLRYSVVRTKAGWRIRNIAYEDRDTLRRLLESKQ